MLDTNTKPIILASGSGERNSVVNKVITQQLSDEDVDKICETINEATKNDENYQKLKAMPSNNGVEERIVTEQIIEEGEEKTYVVDPDTGCYKEEDPIQKKEEYNFDVTLDRVRSYYNNNVMDKNNLDWDIKLITPDDLFQVLDYYQTHNNKIKYKMLPPSIRQLIYKGAINEAHSSGFHLDPYLLDLAAEHFASTMQIELQAYGLDQDQKEAMKQASMDALSDLSKIYEEEVFKRQETIESYIEQSTDEEKKQELKDILKAHIESYELNEFKQAIEEGTIKIKKIDVDKPQKVFAEFNYKYEYNEKFNIHCGIHHLIPIIKTFADRTYTNGEIAMFLVLFCKYCRNFKPEETPKGIEQHSFMSFFISNVYSLRLVANGEEQTQFQANMILKINSLINAIRGSRYKEFIKK